MRNKISILLLALVATMSVQSASAWGGHGHRISAYIAEQHLTPEAKAKCQHYLKHSLPYFASWMDYWRTVVPFREIHYWHTSTVDENFVPVGKPGYPTRDAAYQTERILREMGNGKYKTMSDSMVMVNLKVLVHMVPDMHCPSHTGYPKSLGMRVGPMYVKGNKYAMHKFWDASPYLLYPKWTVQRYAQAVDVYPAKKIKKIQKGNATKWAIENANIMRASYTLWNEGDEFTEIGEKQRKDIEDHTFMALAKGGYRLAAVLNEIFKE